MCCTQIVLWKSIRGVRYDCMVGMMIGMVGLGIA